MSIPGTSIVQPRLTIPSLFDHLQYEYENSWNVNLTSIFASWKKYWLSLTSYVVISSPWTLEFHVCACCNHNFNSPFQCGCLGSNEVMLITALGCRQGGFPTCPSPFEGYCKDGTQMTTNELLKYKMAVLNKERPEGCACKDGIMPR